MIGFSGYYSKDAILEHALLFRNTNPGLGSIIFFGLAGGAAITAFYMFRLWYLTFVGSLVINMLTITRMNHPRRCICHWCCLAIFAICVAWDPGDAVLGFALAAGIVAAVIVLRHLGWNWLMLPLGFVAAIGVAWWIFDGVALADLLEQARPLGTLDGGDARWVNMVWPNEHDSHAAAIRVPATLVAISTALAGFLLATVFYCWRLLDAEDAKSQFRVLHRFLWNKWWFDELYDFLFVRPCLFVGGVGGSARSALD